MCTSLYNIYIPRFDSIMQRVRTKMFRVSIFLVVSVYVVRIILKKTELWKLITNTDTWQSGTLSVWEFLYSKFCCHNNTPTFTSKWYFYFTDKKDNFCTVHWLKKNAYCLEELIRYHYHLQKKYIFVSLRKPTSLFSTNC